MRYIGGDGQSVWKMNSWNEAIGGGVGPAEQPASQEAGEARLPRQQQQLRPLGPRLALRVPPGLAPQRRCDASNRRFALE